MLWGVGGCCCLIYRSVKPLMEKKQERYLLTRGINSEAVEAVNAEAA